VGDRHHLGMEGTRRDCQGDCSVLGLGKLGRGNSLVLWGKGKGDLTPNRSAGSSRLLKVGCCPSSFRLSGFKELIMNVNLRLSQRGPEREREGMV